MFWQACATIIFFLNRIWHLCWFCLVGQSLVYEFPNGWLTMNFLYFLLPFWVLFSLSRFVKEAKIQLNAGLTYNDYVLPIRSTRQLHQAKRLKHTWYIIFLNPNYRPLKKAHFIIEGYIKPSFIIISFSHL